MAAGGRKKGWFRLKLPVIPPDALLSLRFVGIVLGCVSSYTLVALLSPNGLLTQGWAARTRDLAGWAAGPWCVLALIASTALYGGRRALRRAVAGRLAGATLVLLALASGHQLWAVGAPPADALRTAAPGVDGYLGLYAGSGMATWFGVPGALALLVPMTVLGLGLLCGWSTTTWQKLGLQVLRSLRAAGFCVVGLGRTSGRAVRALGHALLRVAPVAQAGLVWTRHRYERWQIARAHRAELRAAERAARAREEAEQRAREERAQAAQAALEEAQRAALVAQLSAVGDGSDANGKGQALALLPGSEALSVGDGTSSEPRPNPPPEGEGVGLTPLRHVDQGTSPGTVVNTNGARWPLQWQLPSTSMLSDISAQQIGDVEIAEKKRLIEKTLHAFGVPVTVKEARVGPTVTQFSLTPGEGVSVKQIKRYEADLQLVLSAQTLRIELPIPGRPVVGLEIPNSGIATVGLREILEAPQFRESKSKLRLALGRDVDGKPRVGALERMPHMLIAGQTGSGKSVCVNTIIASLLFQCTPDELQLLMIDPKMVEMAEYEGIPHLKYPVVTDLAEAGKVLLWAIEEMERRYKMLSELGFRNIESFNKAVPTLPRQEGKPAPKPLPYMVIIIDELADLMMFAPDDVEPAICRLTAKARAIGIHLVVATQRPSVNVVTGLIKANTPSRIAFAVSSQIDSRVILDTGGAENLLGRGDMLYLPFDQGKPLRVQGTWVSDEELGELIHFWKRQGSPKYVEKAEIEALMLKQDAADAEKNGDKQSPLLDKAVALLGATNFVSISYIQRKLGIGYPRAARLLDDLEERGYVEPDEANARSYRVLHGAIAGEPDLEEAPELELAGAEL
ncbi:MAG: DNA translocase FtsK [uncultured Chloroflexi bacterium]|uniref:DNA translocase FtsK n=1 Tax=uncultured Chloroflexota bacterium TaxID=166587 RepID=A0A6J4JKG8_9CHLR|nr:MAG: DNA translocase FtsK [uncultured Chloroflexota bacterium]